MRVLRTLHCLTLALWPFDCCVCLVIRTRRVAVHCARDADWTESQLRGLGASLTFSALLPWTSTQLSRCCRPPVLPVRLLGPHTVLPSFSHRVVPTDPAVRQPAEQQLRTLAEGNAVRSWLEVWCGLLALHS